MEEKNVATNANRAAHSAATAAVQVNRSAWLSLKIRLGRSLWKMLHWMADGWPCGRCRPTMAVWMQGLHDAVNARLGRRVFLPDSYARYASGSLEGGYHSLCVGCRIARAGSRLLARESRPKDPAI